MSERSESLKGRIAVISGASAGIGNATARLLADRGASVVLNARRKQTVENVCTSINEATVPGRAVPVVGDAGDEETVAAMLDAAKKYFGREADAVIVNAGRGLGGSVMTSDAEQWESMIRVNLLGAARLIRAAGERMRGDINDRGDWRAHPHDIVVLGSTVGRHISPFSSMYGATKFGVNSMAEAVRRELGPDGIRVTLVEPGLVATEFQGVAGYDSAWFRQLVERVGPVLEAEDVARPIAFALEQAAHVHLCDMVIRGVRQDYP